MVKLPACYKWKTGGGRNQYSKVKEYNDFLHIELSYRDDERLFICVHYEDNWSKCDLARCLGEDLLNLLSDDYHKGSSRHCTGHRIMSIEKEIQDILFDDSDILKAKCEKEINSLNSAISSLLNNTKYSSLIQEKEV